MGDQGVLKLTSAKALDVADCYALPPDMLTPSLHATCISFHPTKPLVAVAASSCVAVYDLVTNTRLSRHDMRSQVVEMAFSYDSSMLVLVLQDTVILGLSLTTGKPHLLVPKHERSDKPVEHCLLALSGGSRSSLFFCKYGKESVRRAPLTEADMMDAKGRPVRAKEGSWGVKMKLDPAKPITGLCVPVGDVQLLVLHADGMLRSYATMVQTSDTQAPVWQVQAHDALPSKGLAPPGQLLAVPHPTISATHLIVQASRGSSVCVIQLGLQSNLPGVVYRGKVPGVPLILGAGVLQDTQQLVVVGSAEGGRVRAAAVHLSDLATAAAANGLTLAQTNKVEPADLGQLLDFRHPTQPLMLPGALAPAPEYNPTPLAISGPAPIRTTPRTDGMLGLAPPTSAGNTASAEGGGVKREEMSGAAAIAAANALGSTLHSMWSGAPAWSQPVTSSSVLLAGQLLPQPVRVLVHPVLPLLAVQLRPSPQLQASQVGMHYSLAGASPEEYMLSRKLLSVPLLCATSWESLVTAGAPRAMAAPLHTSLINWVPTARSLTAVTAMGTGTALPAQASTAVPGSPSTVSAVSTPTKHQASLTRAAGVKLSLGGAPTQFVSLAGDPALHFNLPGSMYFVSDAALCRYNLVSKAVTTVKSFDSKSSSAESRRVHSVVQSRAGAWLVFFELLGGSASMGGAGRQERWQWTLLLAAQMDIPVWYKTGKYGSFLGAAETHFAVVDASGRLAAVFAVADCNHAGAVPLYVYSLDGLSLNGISMPVFPGPPRDAILDPAASAVVGCVVWQSSQGGLAARPLPTALDPAAEAAKQQQAQQAQAAQRRVPQYYSYDYGNSSSGSGGSSSDEEEAPAPQEEEPEEPHGTGAVPVGTNLGALAPKYWLPLQQGELVLQVAWQSLVLEPPASATAADETTPAAAGAEGATTPAPAASGPKQSSWSAAGPSMGAVLTNQRIMLITEMFNLHASVPLHQHISSSLPCPARSLLWAGPALLVLLADGRVLHVAWDGSVHAVCGIAPHPNTHLVGATHDSLLLLRQVASETGRKGGAGSWEVVARPVNMLQPLVLGWASLAMLPNTSAGEAVVGACRSVLQALVSKFDPAATTPSIVWPLMGSCALDLAYALVSQQETDEPAAYLAAAAAVGEWAAVERALTQELERAAHHPAPPPPGSAAHAKLVAAAAGAVAHGQLSRAVNLLSMAGEWRMAMVVGAAAGDTQVLYKVASQAGEGQPGGQAINAAAQRLAGALRAVYGSTAGHVSDGKLQLCGPDGTPLIPAAPAGVSGSRWQFGAPLSVMPAHVQPSEREGMRVEEGGVIAPVTGAPTLLAALALDSGMHKALNPRVLAHSSTDGSMSRRHGAVPHLGSSNSLTAPPSPSPPASVAPGQLGSPLDDIFGFGLVGDQPVTRDPARDAGSESDSDLSTSTAGPTQQWKGKVTIREKGAGPLITGPSMRLAPPPGTSGGALLGPSLLGAPGPGSQGSMGLAPTLSLTSQLGPIPAVGAGLGPLGTATAGQDPLAGAFGAVQPAASGPGVAGTLGGALPGMAPLAGGVVPPQPQQPAAGSNAFDDDIFGDFFSKPAAAPAAAAQPAAPAAPAAPAPPAATAATWFAGLSPALLAGMQQQQQQQPKVSTQGLSPALAAGMTGAALAAPPAAVTPAAPFAAAPTAAPAVPARPPPAAPPAAFAGVSPALMAGMQPQQPAISTQGLSPALAAGMAGATQPTPAAATASGAAVAVAVDPSQAEPLYFEGVSLLEAGNWGGAEERFTLSLLALNRQPPSQQVRSKQAFCAQYLAAVQLLSVATQGLGPKEAQLYRYAACLALDTKHRVALVREAVARNKQQHNYKYCADTLTWLITTLAGNVPDSMLQPLQRDIEECDKAGGRNAHVARDEDLDDWANLVAMCNTPQDVQQLVGPLCAAGAN